MATKVLKLTCFNLHRLPVQASMIERNQTGMASAAAAAAPVQQDEIDLEYKSARPFDSIPGPRPLPIPYIGNLWRVLPFGTYGNMDLTDLYNELYRKYGSIVKLSGMASFDAVVLYEPELIEKVCRNESLWPTRRPILSLFYMRNVVQKDFYEGQTGLVSSNGEEWRHFRMMVNPIMMIPRNVKLYLNPVVDVCNDFLERIRYIRETNDEISGDFMSELNKLSLETFAFMTLDTRFGCLKNDLSPESETMKMIRSVKESLILMYELDFKPSLWRLFPTPSWKRFVNSMNYILEFTNKHINEKWEKIKDGSDGEDAGNKSILESLLLKTKNPKIAIVMASDTLFAAIDTTSTTMALALYHLAINPEKQEKLFNELKRLLPHKNSPITEDILNELKYTRAVIKESMRIKPTTAVNQRQAHKDMILNNYQIPKGTSLVFAHSTMCAMEKYYKNADMFIPERWLKSESSCEFSHKNPSPFVYLPFGFGQRSCIGKRLAYLEMDIVLSKIIRNFKVIYNGEEPMTWATRLITAPSKPLKFKMTERSE